MFYSIITAFCNLKLGKTQECLDILSEFRGMKPTDTQTAKYISLIYDGLGKYEEATKVLEEITAVYPNKRELNDLLFYSYVKDGNLLK